MLDKFYVINATAEPFTGKVHHIYMKLKRPLMVEYNAGNAGTVADIVSNSLYFVSVGSNAAGATAGDVSGNIRIRYTDV